MFKDLQTGFVDYIKIHALRNSQNPSRLPKNDFCVTVQAGAELTVI